MRRRTRHTLNRIIALLARLSPPAHRELVRGMQAELQAIEDPIEQASFALGAISAIAQLTLRNTLQSAIRTLGRSFGFGQTRDLTTLGATPMSAPTAHLIVRRHATAFAVTLGSLTTLLVANFVVRRIPGLTENGANAGAIAEFVLLTMPFTLAMTIPMSVFVSVCAVLSTDEALASARRERHGFRRLLRPVLGGAAVITALALVLNTQVLPQANARLSRMLAGAPVALSERSMTLGELNTAARAAHSAIGDAGAARAVVYEVEIHKKFALAAACLVLAGLAVAIVMRFPTGGTWLAIGASLLVIGTYYAAMVVGESLAVQAVVSPFVGMWMANGVLALVAVLLTWQARGGGLPDQHITTARSSGPRASAA